MKINEIFETVRAAKNVSYAINEGRDPSRRDLTVLGIADIFDARKRARKPID